MSGIGKLIILLVPVRLPKPSRDNSTSPVYGPTVEIITFPKAALDSLGRWKRLVGTQRMVTNEDQTESILTHCGLVSLSNDESARQC